MKTIILTLLIICIYFLYIKASSSFLPLKKESTSPTSKLSNPETQYTISNRTPKVKERKLALKKIIEFCKNEEIKRVVGERTFQINSVIKTQKALRAPNKEEIESALHYIDKQLESQSSISPAEALEVRTEIEKKYLIWEYEFKLVSKQETISENGEIIASMISSINSDELWEKAENGVVRFSLGGNTQIFGDSHISMNETTEQRYDHLHELSH